MENKIKKYFYTGVGFLAIALGVIGVFLPLMPTTCFLIVAVWAFSKSNPALSQKILEHPKFGPAINNWMQHKSISKKSKCTISVSIIIGFSITLLLTTPSTTISAFLISGMLMLLLYINTRAETHVCEAEEKPETVKLIRNNIVS